MRADARNRQPTRHDKAAEAQKPCAVQFHEVNCDGDIGIDKRKRVDSMPLEKAVHFLGQLRPDSFRGRDLFDARFAQSIH